MLTVDLHGALAVLAALDREQVDYVLVGGLALGVHGLVRATAGIDLFVRPTPENVARLRAALLSVFDDSAIEEIAAADLSGAYAVVRYGPPDADFVVDLIGRIGESFTFDDLESERRVLEGVAIRVATPRTLYRLKKGTLRPVDRADAEAIRRRFFPDEP
jgi:hypothetical protein